MKLLRVFSLPSPRGRQETGRMLCVEPPLAVGALAALVTGQLESHFLAVKLRGPGAALSRKRPGGVGPCAGRLWVVPGGWRRWTEKGSSPGLGPGRGRGPKLDNAGYQSLRKKMVTVIRTQFSAVCPGSGAGRSPLRVSWSLSGPLQVGSHFPREAGTGRGTLAVLSNPRLSSIPRGSHCPILQMRKLSLGEGGALAWWSRTWSEEQSVLRGHSGMRKGMGGGGWVGFPS